MKKLIFLAILGAPLTSASAANLTKAMAKTPEFETTRPATLTYVERCLVMSPFPHLPVVYRAPENPQDSLIYFPTFGPSPLISLIQKGEILYVRLWNDIGNRLEKNILGCLDD